jgi:sugar phosphate isomerase/epimerase
VALGPEVERTGSLPQARDVRGGSDRPNQGFTVMYGGTVRRLPFAEQCRAAALAGCTSLTMAPSKYCELAAQGLSGRDQQRIAAAHGIELPHLDPFSRWTPQWMPSNHIGHYNVAHIAHDWDHFRRMAADLGCRSFTALGTHPAGALETAELIDYFAALCRQAAVEGLRVDLEFAPLWGLARLDQAWDIVRTVAAPNSGIVIDSWHFRRSGSSEELLASIPGKWITGVQLNDGPAQLPADRNIVQDCLYHRAPPGEGDFRVRDLVDILRRTEGLNNVGPEIFSSAFDELDAEAIAIRCAAAMAAVLQ